MKYLSWDYLQILYSDSRIADSLKTMFEVSSSDTPENDFEILRGFFGTHSGFIIFLLGFWNIFMKYFWFPEIIFANIFSVVFEFSLGIHGDI